jgi:hypothetical protein
MNWNGDGSKPWYLVNLKIAGKWMFIPLKMVLIGIDPYPNDTASAQVRLHEISRGSRGQGAQSFQVKRSNQRIAYPDDHDRPGSTTTRTGTTNPMNHEGYGYHMLSHAITCYHCHNQCSWQPKKTEYLILLIWGKVAYWLLLLLALFSFIN